MKKIFISLNLFAILFLVSCNSFNKKSETAVTSPIPEPKAVEIKLNQLATDKDLVCGMTSEESAVADTILHEGKIYGFCSAECKAEFVKNPTAYLVQK